MEPLHSNSRLRQPLFWLTLAAAVFFIYSVASTVYVVQTTGVLHVSSPDKNAVLSISQTNHEAKVIGTGEVSVHLKPGDYQVAAIDKSYQAVAVVKVSKKLTTGISLNPTRSPKLPSVDAINFKGMDTFIDRGLTTTQVSVLKQVFFLYKPSAQTVSINSASVQRGPHDPNKDVSFSINFSVKIDSVAYKASISYSDLNNVRLYLYNSQNNSLVFDSGTN